MGAPSPPQPPDYVGAAQQGVLADIQNYPLRYLAEAASRMGGKFSFGGKTYDFTGLGDASTSARMSDAMAQTMLDIQRAQGPAQIAERLKELQQADPNGYAARKDLFDQIMKSANDNPNRPLAEDLQNSIMTQLQGAGRLDARTLEQVQQSVRGGQAASGNYLGNAATQQEGAAAVNASDTLRQQQQQAAQGFLQSGVTPEDVRYRRIQQSLADLGAFNAGATPTAQFRSLAGAGNGAVPFMSGGGVTSNALTDPNAANMGMNWANQLYSGNVNWGQSQVNPWLAGISTGLSGAGTLSSLWPQLSGAWGGGQQPNLYGQVNGMNGNGTYNWGGY